MVLTLKKESPGFCVNNDYYRKLQYLSDVYFWPTFNEIFKRI